MPPMPRPVRSAESRVADVVELLDRYASADRDLARELEDINAEVSSSQRVSKSTVNRLVRLLESSLVPGVQAKADLDALPKALRREGIAQWARQAVTRAQVVAAGTAS